MIEVILAGMTLFSLQWRVDNMQLSLRTQALDLYTAGKVKGVMALKMISSSYMAVHDNTSSQYCISVSVY